MIAFPKFDPSIFVPIQRPPGLSSRQPDKSVVSRVDVPSSEFLRNKRRREAQEAIVPIKPATSTIEPPIHEPPAIRVLTRPTCATLVPPVLAALATPTTCTTATSLGATPMETDTEEEARRERELRQEQQRWPLSWRDRGALFEGIRPVQMDRNLDPLHHACFNCWELGHDRRSCPRPPTRFCYNYGRRDVDLNSCPRCGKEHRRWRQRRQSQLQQDRANSATGFANPCPTTSTSSNLPARPEQQGGARRKTPAPTTGPPDQSLDAADQDGLVRLAESTRDLSPTLRRCMITAYLEEREARRNR